MSKKIQFALLGLSLITCFPMRHAFPYKMEVQSHAVSNVAIGTDDMRRIDLCFLITLALLLLFIKITFSSQVTYDNSRDLDENNVISRVKRQLEELENDDLAPTSAQTAEEEPSFWDKVVKVALNLFNKFIEWLNSS